MSYFFILCFNKRKHCFVILKHLKCLYLFRAKSIEWQEDRVVREMSCDSIKKEPVLQSNRVVREISIDRYQEEQRSKYAADTFKVD